MNDITTKAQKLVSFYASAGRVFNSRHDFVEAMVMSWQEKGNFSDIPSVPRKCYSFRTRFTIYHDPLWGTPTPTMQFTCFSLHQQTYPQEQVSTTAFAAPISFLEPSKKCNNKKKRWFSRYDSIRLRFPHDRFFIYATILQRVMIGKERNN